MELNTIVYQGSEYETRSDFYSSSLNFARDYGNVNSYILDLKNVFSSSNKEHLTILIERVGGELYDPYDSKKYHSYEELESSGLIGSNTWEMIEEYLEVIKNLGFDGAVIYEGGVENYCVFNKASNVTLNEVYD